MISFEVFCDFGPSLNEERKALVGSLFNDFVVNKHHTIKWNAARNKIILVDSSNWTTQRVDSLIAPHRRGNQHFVRVDERKNDNDNHQIEIATIAPAGSTSSDDFQIDVVDQHQSGPAQLHRLAPLPPLPLPLPRR